MYKNSILYVEDDKLLREQYIKYLKTIFLDVYDAKDGEEALDIYKKKKPQIILLDINMPKRDGLSVAKEIRKKDKNTKIILISAFSEKEKLFEAIPLNLVYYLVKPVKLSQLKIILKKAVDEVDFKIKKDDGDIYISENIRFNKRRKKLIKDDKDITLTKNELRLIELFISQSNKVLETNIIFDYVWDDLNYSMNKLRSLINRLNKKAGEKIINSVYGQGYILNLHKKQ